jgi:hypothetical protein
MDAFDWLYLVVAILSSPFWCAAVSAGAGLIAALVAGALDAGRSVIVRAGVLTTLIVLVPWVAILVVLNTPMGPPLPRTLPSDYLALWITFIVGLAFMGLAGLILLVLIYFEVRAQRRVLQP